MYVVKRIEYKPMDIMLSKTEDATKDRYNEMIYYTDDEREEQDIDLNVGLAWSKALQEMDDVEMLNAMGSLNVSKNMDEFNDDYTMED
jgi:hypothetical protein